jgi:hypothetical protein
MSSKKNDFITQMYTRLSSPDWGIWGKEKYQYTEEQQEEKHANEISVLNKLLENIPERLKIALRFSYAICDLKAYASPLSQKEFDHLSGIYADALKYASPINDDGFRELMQELYCIHKTASEIPDFTRGRLVNETKQPDIWRKYIYLDFFKFSCINLLMRVPVEDIISYTDEVLTAKLVLSYFLGTGSFVEKVSILFSNESFHHIIGQTKKLSKKIELTPEFPDIDYRNYQAEYQELLQYVKNNRTKIASEAISKFLNKRYEAFEICNQYYNNYYQIDYSDKTTLIKHKKPLKLIYNLFKTVSKSDAVDKNDVLHSLRAIRANIDEKYYDASSIPDEIPIKDYLINTTNSFFQGLLYEGKILGLLYQSEHPENGKNLGVIFTEMVPFFAYQYKKRGQLFPVNTEIPSDLPRLVVAHHVHNANCEKLYDKMVMNKLLIWDTEKAFFNISSSSSKTEVVLKERENCLTLGYNHYRIHARQHLKAGNQNRAVFNAIDGTGKEYYFTLDDDYFALPHFGLAAHNEIQVKNLAYFQAPLAFRGMFDNTTVGEQIDAEVMHYFEFTYGYNRPQIMTFPRGTGTIFSFTDGKGSISDTGGFLVDFSCEDFGQGYLSLIQNNSSIFGQKKSNKAPGEIANHVYVIGEGIDLNGKIRQIERWSHGHSKVLFHLLIPAVIKSLMKGETKLLLNKQFLMAFILTAFGIIFRFMLFAFLCLPFIYNSWFNQKNGTYFDNLVFYNIVVLFNFVNVFALFYYCQGKISVSPIRLIAMETILAIPSLKGHIKGMLGFVPKGWRADKTKKFSNQNFHGIYAIILLNVFSLITMKNLSIGFVFWTLFNITLIGVGIVSFNIYRKPYASLLNLFKQISFSSWMQLFVIGIVLNVVFFVLEFQTKMNAPKLVMLGILLYSFILSFRTVILNMTVIYKQKDIRK